MYNKESLTEKMKNMTKRTLKKNIDTDVVLFNTAMRKTFVEGVLQDIKGYFENRTDGKVAISYEECNLKSHEFSFKLTVEKSKSCKQQMWSEVTNAVTNVMNFMFPATDDHGYHGNVDVMTCISSSKLEVEISSGW